MPNPNSPSGDTKYNSLWDNDKDDSVKDDAKPANNPEIEAKIDDLGKKIQNERDYVNETLAMLEEARALCLGDEPKNDDDIDTVLDLDADDDTDKDLDKDPEKDAKDKEREEAEKKAKEELDKKAKFKSRFKKIALGATALAITGIMALGIFSMSHKGSDKGDLSVYDNTSITQSVGRIETTNDAAEKYDASKDCINSPNKTNIHNISDPMSARSGEEAHKEIGEDVRGSYKFAAMMGSILGTNGLEGTLINDTDDYALSVQEKGGTLRRDVFEDWNKKISSDELKSYESQGRETFISAALDGKKNVIGSERIVKKGEKFWLISDKDPHLLQNALSMFGVTENTSSFSGRIIGIAIGGECENPGIIFEGEERVTVYSNVFEEEYAFEEETTETPTEIPTETPTENPTEPETLQPKNAEAIEENMQNRDEKVVPMKAEEKEITDIPDMGIEYQQEPAVDAAQWFSERQRRRQQQSDQQQ